MRGYELQCSAPAEGGKQCFAAGGNAANRSGCGRTFLAVGLRASGPEISKAREYGHTHRSMARHEREIAYLRRKWGQCLDVVQAKGTTRLVVRVQR